MADSPEKQAKRAARAQKFLKFVDPAAAAGMASIYDMGNGPGARMRRAQREATANAIAAHQLAAAEETNRLLREQLQQRD